MTKRIALEGKEFGHWLVLDYAGCDEKKSYYYCRCELCGKVHKIRADKLTSGRTKQCQECRFR